MRPKLIDTFIAGALFARIFEILPRVLTTHLDSGWWGAAIGIVVHAACAGGILRFGRPFVFATLVINLIYAVLSSYMLWTLARISAPLTTAYIPIVAFYVLLSILLTVSLSATQGHDATNPENR